MVRMKSVYTSCVDDVEVLALTDNPNSKAKFNIRLHQPKDQDGI